jgi:hypothetical protein
MHFIYESCLRILANNRDASANANVFPAFPAKQPELPAREPTEFRPQQNEKLFHLPFTRTAAVMGEHKDWGMKRRIVPPTDPSSCGLAKGRERDRTYCAQ